MGHVSFTSGQRVTQEVQPYMSRSTYYVQECPTCGRSLQVRVEYLGKQVVCQHCHARFEACDPASAAYPPSQSGLALLRRAEELLETVHSQKVQS